MNREGRVQFYKICLIFSVMCLFWMASAMEKLSQELAASQALAATQSTQIIELESGTAKPDFVGNQNDRAVPLDCVEQPNRDVLECSLGKI